VSRQYLNGAYARIPIAWDEATGTLTIGPREGSYPGMAERRTFHLRWMRPDRARALDLDAAPDATIEYDGRQQSLAMGR
jgi:alpha-D-xyloside xylohydrolase